LVAPESPSELARRVFQSFDPEGKIIKNEAFHLSATAFVSANMARCPLKRF